MTSTEIAPPPMRSPEDLAKALGVKTQTIQLWCRMGRIRHVRAGILYRIPDDEFQRVLDQGVPPRTGASS